MLLRLPSKAGKMDLDNSSVKREYPTDHRLKERSIAVAPDVVRNCITLPFFQDPLETYFDVCKPVNKLIEKSLALDKHKGQKEGKKESVAVPPLTLSHDETDDSVRGENCKLKAFPKKQQKGKINNVSDKRNRTVKPKRIKNKQRNLVSPSNFLNQELEIIGDSVASISMQNPVLQELQAADKHALQTMAMITQIRGEITTLQENPDSFCGDNTMLHEKRDKLMEKVSELEGIARRVKLLIETGENDKYLVESNIPSPVSHITTDTKRDDESDFTSERLAIAACEKPLMEIDGTKGDDFNSEETPRARLKNDLQNLTREIMLELAVWEAASEDESVQDNNNENRTKTNDSFLTPVNTRSQSVERDGFTDAVLRMKETFEMELGNAGNSDYLSALMQEMKELREMIKASEVSLANEEDVVRKEDLSVLNNEMQHLLNRVKEMELENENLKRKLEESENEKNEPQEDFSQMNNIIKTIEDDIICLRSELKFLEISRIKLQEKKSEINHESLENIIKQKLESTLCYKFDDIIDKYDKSLREFEGSIEKMSLMRENIDLKGADIQMKCSACSSEAEISEWKTMAEKAERRRIELERTLEIIKEEKDDLARTKDQFRRQLDEYRKKYLDAQEKVEELSRALSKRESLNIYREQNLEEEIRILTNKYEEKCIAEIETANRIQEIQRKLDETEHLRLIADVSMESIHRELMQLMDRNRGLEKMLEVERKNHHNDIELKNSLIAQMQAYTTQAENRAYESEKELVAKTQELSNLQKQLEASINEVERQKTRIAQRIDESCFELQQHIFELELELASARAKGKVEAQEQNNGQSTKSIKSAVNTPRSPRK